MDPLSTTASIIAVLQAIGACWKIYSSIRDAKEDVEGLRKEVTGVEDLVKRVVELIQSPNGRKLSTSKELENALNGCNDELQRLNDRLGSQKDRKLFGRIKMRAKWPLTGPEVVKIVENLERWKLSINLALSIGVVTEVRKVSQKLDFAGLPFAGAAAYGNFTDQYEPECLAGTRTHLLKDIGEWLKDPHGKCIFWLSGVAGTGKSTISRTIARDLKGEDQLAASFFFRRGERDRGDASKFFTTLASQLANRIPDVAPSIQSAIEADPDIPRMNLTEQFNKLIFQPLKSLSSQTSIKAALVIDALDECDREEDQRLIVSLLGRLKQIKSINIDMRIFLTSRPELPVRLGFKELSRGTYEDTILHEVPGIGQDISLFLEKKFIEIQTSHSLPSDWPGDENIQKLVEMAVPLFIFAATACRFIADENWDPQEQIKIVMAYQTDWHVWQLEKTYLPILHQIIVNTSPTTQVRLVEEFKQVVGTILNLESPLSVPSLSCLLSISEGAIDRKLKYLHSVLDIPSETNRQAPIRAFHLSFRDFLFDPRLRENIKFQNFWINDEKSHMEIASRCIKLMASSEGLRRNICCLSSVDTLRSDIDKKLIEKHLSPELQYACHYWVYHLERSKQNINDNGPVDNFLRQHILHWLEAISLSGAINEVVQMAEVLNSIVDAENGRQVSELIYDIKRFVLQNRSLIDTVPVQVYVSALIFAPKQSIIRLMFNPEQTIQWTSQLPRVQDDWDDMLQALEHTHFVYAVAFSPNGKVLASASGYGTIRLWDAATGVLLQTLEHQEIVRIILFSPDAEMFASGSEDGVVGLWDAATGLLLQKFEDYEGSVTDITFSPDSKMLVSASGGKVGFRDTATGTMLKILGNDLINAKLIAFSPNGKMFVSASPSYSSIISLWDPATGELLRTLKGRLGNVRAIKFSPDSRTLVSVSVSESEKWREFVIEITFWNVATGERIRTVHGDTEDSKIAAFSPDGGVVALTSSKRVELWEIAEAKLLRTLEGHTIDICAVAFSPDGKTLISASYDRTVRVWNTVLRPPGRRLEQHTDGVETVEFSPDGKILVSASDDKTLRLWDAVTGLPIHKLKGHKDIVKAVKFSPDGKTIASASNDETVRLWDTATGLPLHMLEGHTSIVDVVAFSPDGITLASASKDETVRLWNAVTGLLLHKLVGHTDIIEAFAFSPDGKTIASASNDETIRLWDTVTGLTVHMLEGNSDFINVVFSSDGKTLASESSDNTIRLWDAATRALLRKFNTKTITGALFFSDSDRYINTAVESFLCQTDKDLSLPNDTTQDKANFHQRIFVKDEWLIRGEEKLVWFPHNYRPWCWTVKGNTIVLGDGSGGVSFFTFCDSLSYPLI
ncbi:hypothetical protein ABW20_dc0100899 [Dactylellina cionopaga]|nr:hypothetical protein ABW20_dc0100899 [Dactylellina cionopaga]